MTSITLAPDSLSHLLDAVDAAFQTILHGRYGGGVVATLSRSGDLLDEQVLRPVPAGLADALVVELSQPDLQQNSPSATARIAANVTAGIGSVMLAAGDVHVLTEIFDHRDPNHAVECGSLTTGLLLSAVPDGQAGQMPGQGLTVLRNEDAVVARGRAMAQGQRGWLPQQPRGRVNRGAGLGSNGHRRAGDCLVTHPVAHALLSQIAHNVSSLEQIDASVEWVQVGVRLGGATMV